MFAEKSRQFFLLSITRRICSENRKFKAKFSLFPLFFYVNVLILAIKTNVLNVVL